MFSKEVIRVRISWRAWSVSSMYRANISRNSWPFKSMDSESLEDPDGVLAVVKIRSNSAANASLEAGERSIDNRVKVKTNTLQGKGNLGRISHHCVALHC